MSVEQFVSRPLERTSVPPLRESLAISSLQATAVPYLSDGHINLATTGIGQRERLIVRRMHNSQHLEGEPDLSSLVVYDTNGRVQSQFLQERTLKAHGISSVEDPRIGKPDNYDRARVGVTVVLDGIRELPDGSRGYAYYPADFLVTLTTQGELIQGSEIAIYRKIKRKNGMIESSLGKNITPLWDNLALTRVDNGRNKHALSVVKLERDPLTDEPIMAEQAQITIPEAQRPSWMSERFGTGGFPLTDAQTGDVVLDENGHMTFFVHGQEIRKNKDTSTIVYSIGAMKVNPETWEVSALTTEPLMRKNDIEHAGFGNISELRTGETDVVYVCDGPRLDKDGNLRVFIAAADQKSVKVTLSEAHLASKLTPL